MCLGKCYFLKGYAFLKLSHYHCLLRRKSQSELINSMVPSTSNLSTQESSAVPVWKHLVKAMVFPVVMHGYECWTRKKAECWRIDAFELWCWRRLLRVPWTARTSNQSILKEISPEYPLVGLMAEAEAPILWLPDAKNWLAGKDPDAGKDWRQQEKQTTEDEMVGWHHWLNGYEFEKATGVGDGQGSLVCCSPFGRKELDMTEQLNGLTGANNRSRRCLWSNNEVQSSFSLELLVWKFYSTPIPLPHFLLGKYYLPHRE